jgi:hypothetical protein
MTDKEVGWVAGFIEGEGSFQVQRIKGRCYPRITAWQVDREPIDRLQNLLGGKICKVNRSVTMRKDGYNRQDIYYWELRSKAAVDLLNRISPLLSTRRNEQASKMMNEVGDRFGAFLIGSD